MYKGIGDQTLHSQTNFALRWPKIDWLVLFYLQFTFIVLYNTALSKAYFNCRRAMGGRWLEGMGSFDWRKEPVDPEAVHASSGGKAHGR